MIKQSGYTVVNYLILFAAFFLWYGYISNFTAALKLSAYYITVVILNTCFIPLLYTTFVNWIPTRTLWTNYQPLFGMYRLRPLPYIIILFCMHESLNYLIIHCFMWMKTNIKQFWYGSLWKFDASSFKHQTHLQFQIIKLRVSADLRCSVTSTTTNFIDS
jgi:hypothetical protein